VISWRRIGFLIAIVFFSSLASRSAFAAPNDDQAAKLREAAIYQDYLGTDFAAAEKKLTQALALCEKPDDCSAATRARLHCDLGVVLFATQKLAEAHAQFSAAIQEDPNIAIDADLTTPDLQKEFAAAKSGAIPPAPPSAPAAAEGAKPPKAGHVAQPGPAPAAGPAAHDESGDDREEGTKSHAAKPSDSDCPPGFPGCKSNEPTSCGNDDDCGAGETCVDQKCASPSEAGGPGKANWISLAAEGDMLLLPAGTNVCSGKQGYSCFQSGSSTWYSGTPEPNGGGQVVAGIKLATVRFLASYDRLFGSFTIGGAIGGAIGEGPNRPQGKASLPLQLELRGKYWVGHNPLSKPGFKFYVVAGGGVAEVDGSITTYVTDASGSNLPKTAWRKTGMGFVTVGVGFGALVSKSVGIFLEPRFMQMFPTSGEVLSAQLVVSYGF
jgi:hypothetical protein